MADIENREELEQNLMAALLILWSSNGIDFWVDNPASVRYFTRQIEQSAIPGLANDIARRQTIAFLDEIEWTGNSSDIRRGVEIVGERYEIELAKRLAESHRKWLDERDISDRDGTDYAPVDDIYKDWQAERESVTSVTELASSAEMRGRDRIKNIYDVDLVGYWRLDYTSNFCQKCQDLSNTPDWVWSIEFPTGPPAHPSCRCTISWERSYLTTD